LRKDGEDWIVVTDMKRASHNHEIGNYNQWHTSASKLNEKELQTVELLMRNNMMPKHMLDHLKKENPNNSSSIRQLYNAQRKILKRQMGDLTAMQYLMKLLMERKYITWWQKEGDGDSRVLSQLMFAHPECVELLNLFPYVLLMDATYKTNRYYMPLVQVIGVTSTGQNFHIAFAFLKDEKKESFVWFLKEVRRILQGVKPGVIITDRELAAMNALEDVFPGIPHMLCRRHINENVEVYLRKLTGKKSFWFTFKKRWSSIINAQTETEYMEKVKLMEAAWHRVPAFIQYIHDTWLTPYRHKFVSAWTKEIKHFGAETTNRYE